MAQIASNAARQKLINQLTTLCIWRECWGRLSRNSVVWENECCRWKYQVSSPRAYAYLHGPLRCSRADSKEQCSQRQHPTKQWRMMGDTLVIHILLMVLPCHMYTKYYKLRRRPDPSCLLEVELCEVSRAACAAEASLWLQLKRQVSALLFNSRPTSWDGWVPP